MRCCCLCLFVVLTLVANDAHAAGRRRLWRETRAAHERAVSAAVAQRPPVPDPRAIYPKYQGGFHSRALQNIGVPTGDIGIRGNGFMMNPW
jgi:hypothetical protein